MIPIIEHKTASLQFWSFLVMHVVLIGLLVAVLVLYSFEASTAAPTRVSIPPLTLTHLISAQWRDGHTNSGEKFGSLHRFHAIHCAPRNYTWKTGILCLIHGAGHYIKSEEVLFGVITSNLCNEVLAIT